LHNKYFTRFIQLIALYRDKITMESTGEIWIEEESPVYLNQTVKKESAVSAVSLTNIELEDQKVFLVIFVLRKISTTTFSHQTLKLRMLKLLKLMRMRI